MDTSIVVNCVQLPHCKRLLITALCTLAFRLSGNDSCKRDGFIAKGLTLMQEFWIALFSLFFFEREAREKKDCVPPVGAVSNAKPRAWRKK